VFFFTLAEATPGMKYARISLCTFDDQGPTKAHLRRRLAAMLLSVLPLGLGMAWRSLTTATSVGTTGFREPICASAEQKAIASWHDRLPCAMSPCQCADVYLEVSSNRSAFCLGRANEVNATVDAQTAETSRPAAVP